MRGSIARAILFAPPYRRSMADRCFARTAWHTPPSAVCSGDAVPRRSTSQDSEPQNRNLSRRRLLVGASAALGSTCLPLTQLSSAEPAAIRSDSGALLSPSWESVPECHPSPSDRQGQGPFFIHEDEREDDISLYRQDIRGRYNAGAEPGTEMHLHLRVVVPRSEGCGSSPLRDVDVYIWHCDAQGYYSGFGEPGEQTPDLPYRNRPGRNDLDNATRFCRGAGTTDPNGVVSFRSIFPGWYNGRDIHVHALILERGAAHRGRGTYRGGDHLYTTQLYFEPALIDRVHKASEPYLRRTRLADYAGSILGDERGSSGLRMKARLADGVVVAQMQLMLAA